jgi:hypothetical protein
VRFASEALESLSCGSRLARNSTPIPGAPLPARNFLLITLLD